MTQTWTASLWGEGSATYRAILEHPFLSELTSGTLPPEKFGYYLAQDAHYLRDFARALAVVGSKAPTHAVAGMFARHAAATVDVELALHDSLLPELGLDPAGLEIIPVSPTTLGYTSYLLATAHGDSFADGLAAVLPCSGSTRESAPRYSIGVRRIRGTSGGSTRTAVRSSRPQPPRCWPAVTRSARAWAC